ncbi:MAG: helix-turn-helix transcriptional regulator [Deltaproteobacteria bacterium]|nr:helix-turn-helix transcriptional regulator [Deltaproteobacteria bacterium]MBW1747652.1 helix-turn-helix transcriptional regulator [Deltaproteobacteria bacterium]MBW1825981.1 helix-turn-helix transcriptional regulator [Deltaproteobacteria bacterium]MBW1968498.1 helix-turn-helix transcriptional regulator [Deltaproteobacteria bacterium]MBW2155794.1 helix-turn-helix transcriptional regulator [Deltaproteobacteria bacterium]
MERCKEKILHMAQVKRAVDNVPDPDILQSMTDIFKALSDPSRLKIVTALSACELCVCDLAAVCGASESAVSHQLRILRNLKIVRFRRKGKSVFYRLDDDHVKSLISQSLQHVKE